jgi:predicted DNA binding CopG/RHH family protein
MKFDSEEEETKSLVESGTYLSVKDKDAEISRYTQVAHLARKTKRITIRIAPFDLEQLQNRAIEDGVPYHTLITSIIHKFITGKLVDKSSVDLEKK